MGAVFGGYRCHRTAACTGTLRVWHDHTDCAVTSQQMLILLLTTRQALNPDTWHGNRSSLASLTLSYGMRNVQLNYEHSLFGIRTADCRSLSRALASCETLVHLDLRGNLLDDDKVRQIVAGLSNNCTVTHLDLRHNKVRLYSYSIVQ